MGSFVFAAAYEFQVPYYALIAGFVGAVVTAGIVWLLMNRSRG
jgi:hypothetical protein